MASDTTTPAITAPLPRSRWQAWEGPWLLAVAAIHSLFGLLVFAPVLRGMLAQGWFDTVGADTLRGAVSWFLLFGLPLALLSLCIGPLRRAGETRRLRQLGGGLLGLIALGVSLMPASGFWLALPPALSLLRPRRPGR